MRSIFIVLLIANIGLFAHQYFFADARQKDFSPTANIREEGERLELLAESRSGNVTKRDRVVEDNSEEKSVNKDSICTMVGPYEQLVRAEFLVEKLQSLSVESVITPVERIEGSVFWVYLPPELSQHDALMRLYELQKKNIESYIITKGELERGISFGQYADRLEADLRSDEIKKQGYQPEIKELKKTINETWVTLSPGSAEKISESVWLDILNEQQGLERRQNFCISVANQ